MLRYYSYYSVGGYKDLYLGTNESKDNATYYFSLLPVLEERAKNDSTAAKQVADLKALPQIQQLSAENTCDLPNSARILFSHAGYKIIYQHIEGDKYALAIRDISNEAKDEVGRSIPFLFLIVGDCNADVRKLDILATYMAANTKSVERLLSEYIHMDVEKNGLKFELAQFNEWVSLVMAKHSSTNLPCTSGAVNVHAYHSKVALLVLPNGISQEKAVYEQKIKANEIVSVMEANIISKEDPEKLVRQLTEMAKQLEDERKKNNSLKKGLVIAGASGLIFGALVASCCHK